MSFGTDFSAIVGSVSDAIAKDWTAINAPPKVTVPAITGQSTAGTGVGSALQKSANTTSIPDLIAYILFGAAGIVLVIALMMVRKR